MNMFKLLIVVSKMPYTRTQSQLHSLMLLCKRLKIPKTELSRELMLPTILSLVMLMFLLVLKSQICPSED
jgi:hypothetical protein